MYWVFAPQYITDVFFAIAQSSKHNQLGDRFTKTLSNKFRTVVLAMFFLRRCLIVGRFKANIWRSAPDFDQVLRASLNSVNRNLVP
jgi:hypothetical protein